MAQLAEEMSTFFEDEKVKTRARIRQCEKFVNDVHLQSDSVREGRLHFCGSSKFLNVTHCPIGHLN